MGYYMNITGPKEGIFRGQDKGKNNYTWTIKTFLN